MSPLQLVGLLLLTILSPLHADVKHVLDGTAHPPQCKCNQVQYHQQPQPQPQIQPQASPSNAAPNSFPPWWMNSDSPFKHAYEHFKKCSGNGNCITPAQPNFQSQTPVQQLPVTNQIAVDAQFGLEPIKRNPFLNAQVPLLPGSNCKGTYCTFPNDKNVATQSPLPPQPQPNTFDKNKNPFFNNQLFSASGQGVDNNYAGFLGVQPNVPFNNLQNPRPFGQAQQNQVPQNNNNNDERYENCKNKEYVCVGPELCLNGIVQIYGEGLLNLRTTVDYCVIGKEVCCKLPNLATTNSVDSYTASRTNFGIANNYANLTDYADKNSIPGSKIKFPGGQGISPGFIQVITDDEPKPLASANQNSVFQFSNPTQNPNSIFRGTVDYSGDKFEGFNRFDSNFAGPQYLPPVEETTRRTYPPPISTTYRPITSQTVTQRVVISSPKPFTTTTRPPPSISIYVPPQTTPRTTPAPFTFPTRPSTQYYTPPSTRIAQPSEPFSRVTAGYTYPSPTPSFTLPTKPRTTYTYSSSPTALVSQYVPTYLPPYTTTTTKRVPTYIGGGSNTNSVTAGYEYPSPTPTFNYSPSRITETTTRRYTPPVTYSTPGYRYPTPSPPFTYTPVRTTQPPTRPTYLPPINPDESQTNVQIIKPTTTTTRRPPPPTYIPPIDVGESKITGNFVLASCAAALRCVPVEYCTAGGLISQTQVTLTKDQAAFRVPMSACFDKTTQVRGMCCRDPNYVDPWPSANNLNGNDDGQYREDPSLGQYNVGQHQKQQQQFAPQNRVIRSRTKVNSANYVASGTTRNDLLEKKSEPVCGIRHENTNPQGQGPIDVNFAEIPWQAMVLRDTNRSLLCGGVIVKPNAVLTAAHCVEGLETSDVLIKGGEWKLGIDEEPLPFQIVKVAAIIRHPNYEHANLNGDLALLMLEENLKNAKNINPICLPSANQPAPLKCIVTGWGKRILQVHLRNAIMRSIEVNVMDNQQCGDVIKSKYQHVAKNYSPSTLCGFSNNDQCDVDYGSAIACTRGDNQYTLAGIFSWDTGCKDPSQIGGYIPPDVQWIESTCSKPLRELKAIDKQYRKQ